jgi:hypothetical protein
MTRVRCDKEPWYIHDCEGCEFIVSADGTDVYWCHDHDQWIVRFDSEGGAYSSCSGMPLRKLLVTV